MPKKIICACCFLKYYSFIPMERGKVFFSLNEKIKQAYNSRKYHRDFAFVRFVVNIRHFNRLTS